MPADYDLLDVVVHHDLQWLPPKDVWARYQQVQRIASAMNADALVPA
ncbi:hypothetical protein ACFVAJ_18005 [Agromyces sp. NPDC057679]